MDSENQSAGPSSPTIPKHRPSKKKRQRRKSFAPPMDVRHEGDSLQEPTASTSTAVPGPAPVNPTRNSSFYNLTGMNMSSNTSMDSDPLLDHRDQQQFLKPRRASTFGPGSYRKPPSFHTSPSATRLPVLLQTVHAESDEDGNPNESAIIDESAPLLTSEVRHRGSDPAAPKSPGYGLRVESQTGLSSGFASRPASVSGSSIGSKKTSRNRKRTLLNPFTGNETYNVNYPPSVPGTPPLEPARGVGMDVSMSFGDALLREELTADHSSPVLGSPLDDDGDIPGTFTRRGTIAMNAQEDVCFPQEGLSEMAEDELHPGEFPPRIRSRRRRRKWPDLAHLDEWSRLERIGEERRAKKITEPTLVNGRLRPTPGNRGWYKTEEEEAPYRYTYFNEELQSTIHSHTLSELVPSGASFRELFVPEPPLLSDSSSDSEDEEDSSPFPSNNVLGGLGGPCRAASLTIHGGQSHPTSLKKDTSKAPTTNSSSQRNSGKVSPTEPKSPLSTLLKSSTAAFKPPKYGDRPVWWLDIYQPTDEEMKVISKTFGIHPLTAEDIMLEEAREKVELFRHYYFVNYRTFDQDIESSTYLEPVNMYVVVFREGVLSFHFALTPHAANVRRRVRQLSDYLTVSSDWISYAIIDDITDVFVPLIQNIEDEVDEIDDAILRLHSSSDDSKTGSRGDPEKCSSASSCSLTGEAGGDMLRRVGDCRKRVMSLYRLLGNKADVIKGFAKRCNEHWEVAPRSDIGLYLGDIQDHIVTMTSNLSHYEKILARSHGNYLAQINIRMNERQEQTADVLGKLTVLGTIVLPMNIITGLWGMNVWVPGQEFEGDFTWFVCITGGLVGFGMVCYWIAKRVYGIV